MKSNSAIQRLQQEYRRLNKDPIPYISAQPLPSNLLEWRYIVRGPSGTPYQGGIYQGKLVFPFEYPYKPPSIYMLTPNGRFKINSRLCLSISDFHPDTWNPSWSISSILNGLLSFMCDTSATFGSIETSDQQKRKFAYDSLAYNLKDKIFCELFPNETEEIQGILFEREKPKLAAATTMNNINNKQLSPNEEMSTNVDNISSSWLNSLIGNVLVIIGLAAFAFVVRFILNSTAEIQ